MMKNKIDQIKAYILGEQRVKFAYLFGSAVTGKTGTLSDLDVAVYLDNRIDQFTHRLKLMESLAKILKSEHFDLIVLNHASPLLKYEVVKNGILLKDSPSRRIIFETKVLREYLDTSYLRDIYFHTMKEKIRRGEFFG